MSNEVIVNQKDKFNARFRTHTHARNRTLNSHFRVTEPYPSKIETRAVGSNVGTIFGFFLKLDFRVTKTYAYT